MSGFCFGGGNGEKAAQADLTEHELDGIDRVFGQLIPDDVATLSWRPVRQAVRGTRCRVAVAAKSVLTTAVCCAVPR